MRKFTAAEVQAIIEAERRGEFQLPGGDYTDATLAAALERIDTAAAYRMTARRAIAEMEQPAPAYKDGTDRYQQMRADLHLSQHLGTSMGEAFRIVNQR